MIATDVISSAFASAFARSERLSVSEWSDRHARFKDASGTIIKWETDRAPYGREIMDATQDPAVTEITVKKAEQVGGTEIIQRIISEVIDQRPQTLFYIYPTLPVARRQIKKKLMPSLEATEPIRRRMDKAVAEGKSRKNQDAMLLSFDRMSIFACGSNSAASVEGFAGWVVIDELDRCEPDTFEITQGRGSAIAAPLTICNSTPSFSEMGIDARFNEGDRRRFHVPCPHCGTYDYRRLEDVRWPGRLKDGRLTHRSRDLKADQDEAAEKAFIVCKACNGEISHRHNLWQLRLGVWVPEGCAIDGLTYDTGFRATRPDGNIRAIIDRGRMVMPAWTGRPRTKNHRSYELTGLYRCFPDGVNPYGRLARDFIKFEGNPSQQWWNRRMGLAWSPKGESVDVKTLRKACRAVKEGGFRLRTAPPWVIAAVAVVDVQANHAWMSVYGLSAGDFEGGQQACLLDFRQIPCPVGMGLGAVDKAIQDLRYPKVVGPGEEPATIRIIGSACDSGHRSDEVYQWARLGGARRAVNGVGGGSGRGGMTQLIRWQKLDQDTQGKAIPGGIMLLNVNTWAFKQSTIAQLQLASDVKNARGPDSLGLGGGVIRLLLPEDTPVEWMVQVTAEQFVTTRKNGRIVRAWRMKTGRVDNHALDMHVYFLAYIHAMGAGNLRAAAPTRSSASGQARPAMGNLLHRG